MTLICLHGLVIDCRAPSSDLEAMLTRPFSLFRVAEGVPEVRIEVPGSPPPYDSFPRLHASYSTPRNVVYDARGCRIVDYFGKGATVEDKADAAFTIYGEDTNFLQEAFYLLVLSLFGRYCDRNGMLRIHAMAVSYRDTAVVIPMTMGGGKSTLAMAVLQEEGFKLISDDEPVLDRDGALLPFALRMGTLDRRKIQDIPAEYVYSIDRMEFGLKHFVDAAYWGSSLERRALRDIVYVEARRVLNGPPCIEAIPKRKIIRSLFRDAIVGVGLFQGLEFLLGHSPWTTAAKAGVLLKRSGAAWRMLRNARTYRFTISRDIDENRRVLCQFVRSLDEA